MQGKFVSGKHVSTFSTHSLEVKKKGRNCFTNWQIKIQLKFDVLMILTS